MFIRTKLAFENTFSASINLGKNISKIGRELLHVFLFILAHSNSSFSPNFLVSLLLSEN